MKKVNTENNKKKKKKKTKNNLLNNGKASVNANSHAICKGDLHFVWVEMRWNEHLHKNLLDMK